MKKAIKEEALEKSEEIKIIPETGVIDESKEESTDESVKSTKSAKAEKSKEKKEVPVNGSFRFNKKNKS